MTPVSADAAPAIAFLRHLTFPLALVSLLFWRLGAGEVPLEAPPLGISCCGALLPASRAATGAWVGLSPPRRGDTPLRSKLGIQSKLPPSRCGRAGLMHRTACRTSSWSYFQHSMSDPVVTPRSSSVCILMTSVFSDNQSPCFFCRGLASRSRTTERARGALSLLGSGSRFTSTNIRLAVSIFLTTSSTCWVATSKHLNMSRWK